MASYAENKKAKFDYELLDKYEAGIELLGFEVKSVRSGRANLSGTYVIVRGGEAYLVNANIPPYQAGNTPEDYDPLRTRRLLLNKKEIEALASKTEANKRLTIVPLSMYNKGRKIKLEIALAKGKKEFDKRETIKRREADREMGRAMKKEL